MRSLFAIRTMTVSVLAVDIMLAMLVIVPFDPHTPFVVDANSLDGVPHYAPVCHSLDDPFCHSEIKAEHNYVNVTANNWSLSKTESRSEYESEYESPAVEWCRRRPTWKNSKDDPETITNHEKVVSMTCENVLNHQVPDHEYLTNQINPVLSSTFYGNDFSEPESNEWYDKDSYHSLPVLERPVFSKMEQCTEDLLSFGRYQSKTTTATTGTLKKPSIARVVRRRTDGKALMAVVENALSQEQADAVIALAHCARTYNPPLFWNRPFASGGNDVTFLNGFLQILAPGVGHQIQSTAHLVWSTVGWSEEEDEVLPVDARGYEKEAHDENDDDDDDDDEDEDDDDDDEDEDKDEDDDDEDDDEDGDMEDDDSNEDEDDFDDEEMIASETINTAYSTRRWPDPISECGIRTTEHLSYEKWGVLGYHDDGGSEYTVLVALSDPDDYEGGEFNLCPLSKSDPDEFEGDIDGPECLDKVSIKPKKLSAIVFLSAINHGVTNITSSGRVMFANELWRYGDVPAMSSRPGRLEHVLDIDYMDDDQLFADEDWEYEEPDDEFVYKDE